jgi:hypothetical protein
VGFFSFLESPVVFQQPRDAIDGAGVGTAQFHGVGKPPPIAPSVYQFAAIWVYS